MTAAAEDLERHQRDPRDRGEAPGRGAPPASDAPSGRGAGAGSHATPRLLGLDRFSALELDRYDQVDVAARQIAEISFDLGETERDLARLNRDLGRELERAAKLVRSLRSAVSRARMTPLDRLFRRFRRWVRRAGRDLGKPLRLEVHGEGVEVDTAIAERLADPLLHLVSNALSHGIEGAEERRAAGKPEEGTLWLRAYAEGPYLQLEVEDDGRGLDAAALRSRAVELGLLGEPEAARLSDSEAHELIFRPGFSMARQVTGAAGRGIGMDVVRAAVAELNGQIRIETAVGQGTRFTLRLPSTLVVSTVLKVRAASEVLALPMLNVRRLLHVAAEGVERREEREVVPFEGEEVELVRLAPALLLEGRADLAPLPVAVVEALGRTFALAVDELVGIEEVVVRGLGEFLAGLERFGGVTVSPDGQVALLLDPVGLYAAAAGARFARPAAVAAPPAEEEAGLPVLLADDSISVRKILGRQLAAAGYEVATAQDGEEALAAVRRQSFAALITDLEMPRLNGFELLDAVRRRPESRHLPVIVITTRAARKHRDLALRLGASAYLAKPIDPGALVEAIRAAVPEAPRRAGVGG